MLNNRNYSKLTEFVTIFSLMFKHLHIRHLGMSTVCYIAVVQYVHVLIRTSEMHVNIKTICAGVSESQARLITTLYSCPYCGAEYSSLVYK